MPATRKLRGAPDSSKIATRFYASLGILFGILLPAEFVLAHAVHLHGVERQLLDAWPGLTMMSACVLYVRWRPLPKLIETAQLVLISCLTFYVMGVLIHIAGRSPYPLADQQLANLDAALHFRTASFVQQVAAWRPLRLLLAIAYGTTGFMVIGAATIPAILGRAEASYRFILSIIFAVLATAALFYRWPAIGPWTVECFAPARDQAAVGVYLTQLRSALPVIDMKSVAIVSFPSFHTVMAVSAAYALNCIQRVRWFTWTLCVLICVSTVSTGWHYGVDVLAGLALAVACNAIAGRMLKATAPREELA
ncbi:MAG TPA: phosphatase PAP2 family protein [Terracidiphilus sp.]